LVSAGKKKMSSMGSVAPAAAAGGKGGKGAPAAVVEEKPKEEEAADVDMGGLFGDDEY
jgi:ribosomal protein L12E/L44/L45/RPP1/RPP2